MDLFTLIALIKALKTGAIQGPLEWKDSVPSTDDLPVSAQNGDVYHVAADGCLYAYNGKQWKKIGPIVTIDVALNGESTNPVENRAIFGKMTSTAEADALYHLGFYLDNNGDLCQKED